MASSVPELQQKLFKRMGLDVPEPSQGRNSRPGWRPGHQNSRKEQRKANRVQKKTHIYSKPSQPQPLRSAPPTTQRKQNDRQQQNHPKPIIKQSKPSRRIEEDDDDDEEDEDELEEGMSLDEDEDGDIFDEDDEEEEEDGKEDDSKDLSKKVPKAVQDRLAQDDAEIEEFERKLGIKKGRKSLPQAFKEDGLDDLMGDLGDDMDGSDDEDDSKKRKSEYDDWLASKRRKTAKSSEAAKRIDDDDDEGDLSMGDDFGSEDENLDPDEDDEDENMAGFDDESFDGFDSDGDEKAPSQPRQRENPYVAPTTGVTVAKYVPPSLRKAAGTEDENRIRLRRQVQGLINRLTDANLLSIVQSTEELYQKNARGDVTEVITDAIMTQICKPESLPDQFFVLVGGFAAATYRLIGSSFGSHLIRRVVTDFGAEYDRMDKDTDGTSGIQKEASNLLTFLSQLYVFEVVTCKILFDYMERLLSDLNEINVELLLRICRMGGRLMRRDDPQALKHVSTVLNQEVSKVGYASISARTKFMIETIADLKNSKPKARGMDSAVVSEHVQRMRKKLGELKSQSRRQEGLAPMGIGLEDVEGADTRGKWWLVGASVPNNLVNPKKETGDKKKSNGGESSDEEDMDFVLPDFPAKARAQGLSGTPQIAIFTALMSAPNYEEGYKQFLNLRLKKDDQLEIARVLIQCVGSEVQYNPYYALVGRQACSNSKIRFALQDRLWKIFRGLGESLFGEEPDDDETADGERMKDERRISNVARFYASLVTDGALTIAILKPLELPELNNWTSMFVQWFVIALLQECRGKGPKEDSRVEKHFGAARELPGLAAGLHWILQKKTRKSKLLSAKEAKKLDGVREKAQAAVQAVAAD
jgi:nucleolar MIF4G domain-containing protein 1